MTKKIISPDNLKDVGLMTKITDSDIDYINDRLIFAKLHNMKYANIDLEKMSEQDEKYMERLQQEVSLAGYRVKESVWINHFKIYIEATRKERFWRFVQS